MARILITGSSDGIGLVAARALISQGHQVFLHARNFQRATHTKEAAPGGAGILIADISSIAGMKKLAADANELGSLDCVVHNAGLGYNQSCYKTEDGFASLVAVNTIAPYVLTCLMHKPKQLLYVSSGLASGGRPNLEDMTWSKRSYGPMTVYCESKVHDILLAFAAARLWPDVESNAIDPEWVQTKLGSFAAPGNVEDGADTIVWLAGKTDDAARSAGSGRFFRRRKIAGGSSGPHEATRDPTVQDRFLETCEALSGVAFPRN